MTLNISIGILLLGLFIYVVGGYCVYRVVKKFLFCSSAEEPVRSMSDIASLTLGVALISMSTVPIAVGTISVIVEVI